MSKFEDADYYPEDFPIRLQESTFRVKANKWFSPETVQEDGNEFVLSALRVASRFGNRSIRRQLQQDPNARLVIPADLQGVYYKSAVGLLQIGDELCPVRLETLNADGETGFPMVQHALIDTREDSQGQPQIRFR